MVDLPRTALDRSVTQGAQSAVSGGEIRSAFGELAAGLDTLGETLESASIEKAGLEGQGAVYKDGDGKLRYDSRNPLSRAGKAFNRSAQTAYVSQISMDARPAIANLEAEAKGNVNEFDKLSREYARNLLKGKDPLLRGAIESELTSLITSSRTGMIRTQQTRDLATQNGSITARIKMAHEDAAALARTGGTNTPEYAEQLDIIRTLENEKVNNPLFAYSKEESDVFLRGVEGAHMAEAIVGQVEEIYHKPGGGLKEAKAFAFEAFKDPQLNLSPGERVKYRNAALGALKQFSDEMKVERDQAREEARVLTRAFEDSKSVDEADVYEVVDRLSNAGDAPRAMRLLTQFSISKQLAYAQQLSDEEQATALGTGTLGGVDSYVNKIVMAESGGNPNAKNPLSSASGVGQFIDSTWLTMIKTHRPDIAAGRSDGEILSLKTDAGLGREMVKKFGEQNAAALTSAGFSATAGNIYLAHFLGVGGAKSVLGADSRTSVASIVGEKVIAANPFLAGMNVADLRAWSNRKMGGPDLHPEVYSALRKEVTSDVKRHWETMKKGLMKGDILAQSDIDDLGRNLAILGDRDLTDDAVNFLQKTGDYSVQTLAQMESQILEIEKGGVSVLEQDAHSMMMAVRERTERELNEDPLNLGRRMGAEIEPLNFTDSAALGAGLAKNIQAGRIVAKRYARNDVPMLTRNDAAAFQAVVATGDVQQAAIAMQALAEVPDDLLRGTLALPEVKEALISASQSTDYDRYGAAMVTMDKLYNRAPQEFARIFEKDGMDALQDWQGRLRYFNPVELEAEFKRRADPTYAARQRDLEKKGLELARNVKSDTLQTYVGGPLPTDPTIAAALNADWQKIFSERYAATQNALTASKQTGDRLRQHWGTSVTNNGELMLHPPENYYPPINGSYDWIKDQLNDDLVKAGFGTEVDRSTLGYSEQAKVAKPGFAAVKVQKAWPHMLVADAVTEAEAAAGKPPSYRLVVTNPNTGYSDFATDADGKELSIRFDNAPALADAHLKYSEQRKRYLSTKPLGYAGGGW